MSKYATVKDYKIDVKGNAILIYTAEQDIEALANIFKDTHPDPLENVELMTTLRHVIHFSPMLVFQLVDGTRRTFQRNATASSGRWMTGSRLANRGNCPRWSKGMSNISARIPMWNCGKSTDRAPHPEMRSYRIEGVACGHAYLCGTGVMPRAL